MARRFNQRHRREQRATEAHLRQCSRDSLHDAEQLQRLEVSFPQGAVKEKARLRAILEKRKS